MVNRLGLGGGEETHVLQVAERRLRPWRMASRGPFWGTGIEVRETFPDSGGGGVWEERGQ